ncbi:PIG-L family deacetylase [Bailinhaonella thermotolerans]|uniref:PIG-L family deacetylase n=1 Tax=Bailinhaonella thermotolerans TaxID=1070861 RepID=A0A3A4B3T0_9ACTN|nr:PIG-L family deacetylase [Bailinhaonella thermotolerans]RJL32679.1 PIG-L family deacetylase [Bailinhaonella thermotolerans]
MSRTCVFFHAHPDDEALLTAGTMARLAAEGNRVVLVVATAGERGLAAEDSTGGRSLGEARMAELHASADALGVARVVPLGYSDSGLAGPGEEHERPADAFMDANVEEAARRLAAILDEEKADLLTIYDPAGGYGHPDHVQVHRVGVRAAELAGTPTVLEATVDRDLLLRGLRLLSRVYRLPPEFDIRAFERAYTPRSRITHRIKVGRYAKAKRAAMAAHVTQTTGGDGERTLAALLRIPGPLFRLIMGTEWYVRRDAAPGTRLDDPFAPPPGVGSKDPESETH